MATPLKTAHQPPFVDLNALMHDPHEHLAALRADHAVLSWGENKYLVLRATDVMELLNDPQVMALPGADFVAFHQVPEGRVARLVRDILLLDNGESHRTKRGLFARAFAHRSIDAQRPAIRHVAERLTATMPHGVTFDFVRHMAAPLPAAMIAAILGLPENETDFFTTRVYALSRIFMPFYPLNEHDAIESAASDLFTYVSAHLYERLADEKDDPLSSLVHDWWDTKPISFDNLVHQVIILILAGSDTTRAAFAMLVALLLQHPEQWQAVRDDASLIPGAVLEALRYEPSVASTPRMTREALSIDGIEIPAGAMLSIQTLSAMRDPALYDDPDRFDITRSDHPRLHLVFGAGVHRCIGEKLARVEMEEGLAALLSNVPDIELIEPPRMIGTGGIRQITPMPVVIR